MPSPPLTLAAREAAAAAPAAVAHAEQAALDQEAIIWPEAYRAALFPKAVDLPFGARGGEKAPGGEAGDARKPSCSLALAASAGPLLFGYGNSELLLLSLRDASFSSGGGSAGRFVTCRVGPIGSDGLISKEGSVKVSAEWEAGSDLQWVLRNIPLLAMARKSPLGLVACRFKLWAQSRFSRRWLGRTSPVVVPAVSHRIALGGLALELSALRGRAAELAALAGARLVDPEVAGPMSSVVPLDQLCQNDRGHEILTAVIARQWGIAAALVHELRLEPEELRKAVLATADGTRRTALRLCVDAQGAVRPSRLRALEEATIVAVMCCRRPYWWSLHITSVCHRSLSFLGEIRIGMPRSRHMAPSSTPQAFSSSPGTPQWQDCCWSEPQDCKGTLAEFSGQGASQLVWASLQVIGEADLTLHWVDPGETTTFGESKFANPMSVRMLTAAGTIAGSPASGTFDLATCARMACEGPEAAVGPRDVAALVTSAGADPRALADDGLSPYTAALFGEDPCGLLQGLDASLQARMLAGDGGAWAEAGRGSHGCGHADLVAAPLKRGLPVPHELAQGLLNYCFTAQLPLLATRVLERIDGQQFLLQAMERAESGHWLRVGQKILQQKHVRVPCWCDNDTLAYAIVQVQEGRHHFHILLDACLVRLRGGNDFYDHPTTLGGSSAGGAECPICFEPLCRGVPVAFVDDSGRAVCPHFLCASCARGYEASASASASGGLKRCPECRRSAPKATLLPRLSDDPLGWFDFLTAESGAVARSTLLRAVSAMLPVDAEQLGRAIDEGLITSRPMGHDVTAADFLTCGLYAWVWRHELEHKMFGTTGPLPDISDREEWFQFWNVSQTGLLLRSEVFRAILRYFGASSLDRARVATLRKRFDIVWESCMLECRRRQGHSSARGVTEEEFAREGGLGDLLEEAFGMDPKEVGLRPVPKPEDKGANPLSADALEWTPQRPTRPGAAGTLTRERLNADIAARIIAASRPKARNVVLGSGMEGAGRRRVPRQRGVPASGSSAPVQLSGTVLNGSAAGVLGLLDDEDGADSPTLPGQDRNEMASSGEDREPPPCSDQAQPQHGRLPGADMDAMEALEGLERDLGLRTQIISL